MGSRARQLARTRGAGGGDLRRHRLRQPRHRRRPPRRPDPARRAARAAAGEAAVERHRRAAPGHRRREKAAGAGPRHDRNDGRRRACRDRAARPRGGGRDDRRGPRGGEAARRLFRLPRRRGARAQALSLRAALRPSGAGAGAQGSRARRRRSRGGVSGGLIAASGRLAARRRPPGPASHHRRLRRGNDGPLRDRAPRGNRRPRQPAAGTLLNAFRSDKAFLQKRFRRVDEAWRAMQRPDAATALNRFGLGARPGDPLPADPKAWLKAQFTRFEPRPRALAQVPSRSTVVGQLADYTAAARADARSRRQMQPASLSTAPQQQPQAEADPLKRFLRQSIRDDYIVMNAARLSSALTTDSPFAERLVHFWANHFAVSVDKLPVIGLAGLLEFEAIRPHLFGRFSDLLLAVEQHPAILVFLDQAQSIGPNSQIGRMAAMRGGKQRGLNENLAREAMELHTLGVRTGYSQADVTEFARALTGWTVSGLARGPAARFIGGADDGSFT